MQYVLIAQRDRNDQAGGGIRQNILMERLSDSIPISQENPNGVVENIAHSASGLGMRLGNSLVPSR